MSKGKPKIYFKVIKPVFVRQKPLAISVDEKNLKFCVTWQPIIHVYIVKSFQQFCKVGELIS